MREWSKRLEAEIFGDRQAGMQQSQSGFWVRQRSVDGQSVVYAASSQEQGVRLDGVSVFTFDPAGHELERIEAKRATLEPGHWRLEQAVVYASGAPPRDHETYLVKTNLTAAQVRESFSTPETVPFWDLPTYIEIAERSGLVAAGYKLQYQLLIARPFLLCRHGSSCLFCQFAILPLRRRPENGFEWRCGRVSALCHVQGDGGFEQGRAAASSCGGVVACARGGLTGFVVLLYQEDG